MTSGGSVGERIVSPTASRIIAAANAPSAAAPPPTMTCCERDEPGDRPAGAGQEQPARPAPAAQQPQDDELNGGDREGVDGQQQAEAPEGDPTLPGHEGRQEDVRLCVADDDQQCRERPDAQEGAVAQNQPESSSGAGCHGLGRGRSRSREPEQDEREGDERDGLKPVEELEAAGRAVDEEPRGECSGGEPDVHGRVAHAERGGALLRRDEGGEQGVLRRPADGGSQPHGGSRGERVPLGVDERHGARPRHAQPEARSGAFCGPPGGR